MSFYERIRLANRMEFVMTKMLTQLGFKVEKTGYESYISDETKNSVRSVHDIPTVLFLRYAPDLFVWKDGKFFFVELKVMDSPIKLQSRVDQLITSSGISDLSRDNIGVVETAAINHYTNLTTIGVDILVIVYCTYNQKVVMCEWENNIVKFFNDNVRIGDGDASKTPFTNIHLDKMRTLKDLFQADFNIGLSDDFIINVKKALTVKK